MFAIDTGETVGSRGPWISWTSNGSAEKGFLPRTWIIRGKDEADQKYEKTVVCFENGCVMDLDTLRLGWEKDAAKGMMPERRWNPTIAQATPRPDESKTPAGKSTWSRAVSVRCAIGGGQAATWEQASYGAYDAFAALSKQISAEWSEKSQNGVLLPLVKQTGVTSQQMSGGNSNKPVLEVVEWVPRPDCLKDDAPVIQTEQPKPVPTQAQAAAAPATQASSGGF